MHRIINHLIQLQELTLVREQEAFMGGDRLAQLDLSIKNLTEQLPINVRTIFQKLQKKDPVVVVPVSNGGCSTCGMKLPISLVQSIRAEEHIQYCPNCTRLLYYTDSVPRSVAQKQRRTEPRKVGIDRFSAAELMIPRLEATDVEGALRELAGMMEKEGFVSQADKLVESALRREAIISTSVDHGLAFPHVRGVEGGGLTLALGLSPKGIQFNHEKSLSHVIFFMVIPTAANAFYLKLLAGLAETFMQADARQALMEEDAPAKLWKTLKKLTRRSIP